MSAPNKHQEGFNWRAALLGGAVAIAAAAFFGTLTSNITLWMWTQGGLSPQEAWRQLFDSTGHEFFSAIVAILCNAIGGYTASSTAPGRFVVYGVAAGAISLLFVAVMYATPMSLPANVWTVVSDVLIPIPAAVLGSFVHARRALQRGQPGASEAAHPAASLVSSAPWPRTLRLRMPRAKFIAVACGVALVIATATFWFGVREGMRLGVMLDSAPRGSIAVAQLRALDAGKTGNLRIALEGDVDMALIWAYHIQDYPLRTLFEPIWGYPMHYREGSLERAANYRKTTPSPMRAEALAKQPSAAGEEARARRDDLLEGARENDQIIELMIQRYSSKPKNEQP